MAVLAPVEPRRRTGVPGVWSQGLRGAERVTVVAGSLQRAGFSRRGRMAVIDPEGPRLLV